MLSWVAITLMGWDKESRFLCQDETRLGLKTISGRKITARGVKPIGKVQWKYSATYLYGVVEPKTGEHFFYEFSHLNSQCFQVFLELVAQHFADTLLIIQLDNGGFHLCEKDENSAEHYFNVSATLFARTQSYRTGLAISQTGLKMEIACVFR